MGFFDFLFGDSGVKFKKKYTENRNTIVGPATYYYEVFTAKTAQEARDYLNTKAITAANTYCIVETPEGNWGKDKDGMYKENS
ncbi:MAG: hypothetical protein ACKVP0_07575 [Pirellulaceae bacterium]